MSIASVISSIETNVANAYTSIGTKGGTIPANKNIANLATAIDSISAGGGSSRTYLTKKPLLTLSQQSTINTYKYWVRVSTTGNEATSSNASHTWTDGDNIFLYYAAVGYKLDRATLTWDSSSITRTFSGAGDFIWTDGTNIYFSSGSTQYQYNKTTGAWSSKSWSTNGSSVLGTKIWTDGTDIYVSNGTKQLKKNANQWATKSWSGLTNIDPQYIWTDGTNIYYGAGSTQYVLNKSTSTWTAKTWNGTSPSGNKIFTDGEDVYFASSSDIYKLDKTTSTWSITTEFHGGSISLYASTYLWTDGEHLMSGVQNDSVYMLITITDKQLPTTRVQ